MKRFILPAGLVMLMATPAFAQTGNGAPSGPHYNLNIIGVENPKTATLTGSDRHTIFVALGNNGTVESKIYLTPGDFQVCDGNAFDFAYDCSGTKIQNEGAVFQLPCNTNLSNDPTKFDLVPCDIAEQAAYEVWARALGTPYGTATITTCATDPATQQVICSAENVVLVRLRSKPTFTNVTNELTSLVANIDADPQLERVALFAGNLEDWFWKYQNTGLRLAQIRFYLLP
jgi:hypothetical protein